MNLLQVRSAQDDASNPTDRATLRSWLLSWEVYLVLLVAGFLRFYQLNTTEFDEDQAMLFRLAHDAIRYGLLPVTSNAASIGISNPPGVIYLFMPVAFFTANPLGGAMLVGLFTTVAALLTYFFTRRYYGRFAGAVAALLYATAAEPLNYARFIWQPNLMPPFVVLFLFTLFLGVVERRKGWLFPALVLFGILYQMHPTTVLLAAPLVLALVLAPGTLRWRDLLFAGILLVILFFPYLLWEVATKFADLRTVLTLAKQHAHLDSQAVRFYVLFLSPYTAVPTYAASVVRGIAPFISWLHYVVPLLTVGGFLVAILLLFRSTRATLSAQGTVAARTGLQAMFQRFRADRYRCGLLILLVWQLVPLAVLSRHAVDLHAQYFFMLMPGPFILVGLLLAKLRVWSRTLLSNGLSFARWMPFLLGLGVAVIVGAQFLGSSAAVVDASSGNFNDRAFQPYPYHNDLQSLRHALSMADVLAQHEHLSRVYVTTDAATQTAIRYLAEQMQTPTTLFDVTRCLVLPNPASGPAVLLVGPYDTLTTALLAQFATTRLVEHPARLGGNPFSLYVVNTLPLPPSSSTAQEAFTHQLQLLDAHLLLPHVQNMAWAVTRWSLLQPGIPALRTTYNYRFQATNSAGQTQTSVCTLTTVHAGDQLLVAFPLTQAIPALPQLTLQAVFYSTLPANPTYGPFHLETDGERSTPWLGLQTNEGKASLLVQLS